MKLERRGYCLGLAGGSSTPPPPSHPSQCVPSPRWHRSASAREKVPGLGISGWSFSLGEGHDTRQEYPGCLAVLGADMSGALLLIACRAADRGYRAQDTRSARRAVAMAAVTRAHCTGPELLGSRHPRLGPTWLGACARFRYGTDLDSDRRRPHRDSVDAWRCRQPRYDMSDANMTAVPLRGCSTVVYVRECHTPPSPPTESKMAPRAPADANQRPAKRETRLPLGADDRASDASTRSWCEGYSRLTFPIALFGECDLAVIPNAL